MLRQTISVLTHKYRVITFDKINITPEYLDNFWTNIVISEILYHNFMKVQKHAFYRNIWGTQKN